MSLARTALVVVGSMIVALAPARARAQASPSETLRQYVLELQKTPDDAAVRERIIRFVQTMNPAPELPEDARRACIEGQTLFRLAKEQRGGFDLSIDAYRQCLLLAPWLPEAYNNYAFALEAAGRFDEAIAAARLYLASNPGPEEARRAQDKIYEIGAEKKLAAARRSAAPPAAQAAAASAAAGGAPPPSKESSFDALKRKIDGRRYAHRDGVGNVTTLEVRGNYLQRRTNGADWGRFEIQGRSFTCPSPLRVDEEYTFTLGEDGERIVLHVLRRSDGASGDLVYLWQR